MERQIAPLMLVAGTALAAPEKFVSRNPETSLAMTQVSLAEQVAMYGNAMVARVFADGVRVDKVEPA